MRETLTHRKLTEMLWTSHSNEAQAVKNERNHHLTEVSDAMHLHIEIHE